MDTILLTILIILLVTTLAVLYLNIRSKPKNENKEAEEIAKKYRKRGFKADVQPSGTRNLVVFDDKIIDIVKRYGIAGAATLLGMSQLDLQAAMAQENRNNRGLLER